MTAHNSSILAMEAASSFSPFSSFIKEILVVTVALLMYVFKGRGGGRGGVCGVLVSDLLFETLYIIRMYNFWNHSKSSVLNWNELEEVSSLFKLKKKGVLIRPNKMFERWKTVYIIKTVFLYEISTFQTAKG